MTVDDPVALDIMRRAMVARIATLSRGGRPMITPIYFVEVGGHVWLGTPDWTLAVRNVRGDPRVSVLLDVERDPGDRRTMRITGRATVRDDRDVLRSYALRVVRKYILTLGGIRDMLAHVRQAPLIRHYYAQSAAKGHTCVIDVTPEHIEVLLGAGPRRRG